ncbi:MAG: hypothetical protein V4760_15720, partial [Bdellovibrionota bacterium]
MKRTLENQRGAFVLPFALVMSVVIAGVFMFATQKIENLIRRYYVVQGVSYAQDLSAKLAVKLRWSYDVGAAIAANPANAPMCAGGSLDAVGTSSFCLVGGAACVQHPKSGNQVCVSPSGGTLVAWRPTRHDAKEFAWSEIARLLLPRARAVSPVPLEPPVAETSNDITGAPVCIGGNCGAICNGTEADCFSFTFCPLTKACGPDEMVWQTVGFL